MPDDIKVTTLAGLLAQADVSAEDFIATQSLEKSAAKPRAMRSGRRLEAPCGREQEWTALILAVQNRCRHLIRAATAIIRKQLLQRQNSYSHV